MSGTFIARRLAGPTGAVDIARVARPQLTVMAAQCAAGVGNLAFAVVLSRVFDRSDYAQIVAFLAVYFLLHVPAAALTAAGALAPDRLERVVRQVVGAAAAAGLATVGASVAIARVLDLPPTLVMILGVAMPGAALLGLRRGVAYGREEHRQLTASLLTEPLVRLGVGGVLAVAVGPIGAAAATVAAGYVAVAACAPGRKGAPTHPTRRAAHGVLVEPRLAGTRPIATAATVATGLSFVLVAVLQTTDVLVANRILLAEEASRFGVLSTLGGAAVFATATVPMVLIPAMSRDRPRAASTATLLTLGVGVTVAVSGFVLAEPLLLAGFGPDYADVGALVGPYLLAMTLVAVVRVRIAQAAATGLRRWEIGAVAVGVVAEAMAIIRWADRAEIVVAITLLTTAAVTLVLEVPRVVRLPAPGVVAVGRHRVDVRAVVAIGGLCAFAAVVRLATSRGLWVDEAISVQQAQLPFGEMISDIRATDVHPPLHHILLWGTVRTFGTSPIAVRLPSLAAGIALVPVMAWLGRVVYDRRTGWIAATFAAVAPFCVWYSQEARMYSLFMLVAALAVGTQVQAIRRGRTTDWVLYGVTTGVLVWTQYFALLPIAVQQVGFAWVVWRSLRDPARRRSLLRGWTTSAAIVVLFLAPLLPILREQLEAYSQRGAGLVPGQAGAGSSGLGGSISIYAVGANLVWAVLGYHADDVMIQIAALWPLLMLLAFMLLGRGRSGRSLLLFGLVVVPMGALFAIGAMKRDLFELRYFSGAVPVMLLLAARLATATARRRTAVVATATLFTAVMAVGLVDQQLNGANPRLYDFEGALGRIEANGDDTDVLLYEPSYLSEVIEYYAPGLEARPVGSRVPANGRVWVLATDRVLDAQATSARLGSELAELERDREVAEVFERPNVRVWRLER